MNKAEILKLLNRPVATQPLFVSFAGSSAAIFLSQLLYWSGKGRDANGWIFKTQDEWKRETGLRRSAQETSRRKLRDFGIVEEKYCGVPAQLFYRINFDVLGKFIEEAQQAEDQGQKVTSKTRKQACSKPASQDADYQQPSVYTESTHEITAADPSISSNEQHCNESKPAAALVLDDQKFEAFEEFGVVINNGQDRIVLAKLASDFGHERVIKEAKAIIESGRRAYTSTLRKHLTAVVAVQKGDALRNLVSTIEMDQGSMLKGSAFLADVARKKSLRESIPLPRSTNPRNNH